MALLASMPSWVLCVFKYFNDCCWELNYHHNNPVNDKKVSLSFVGHIVPRRISQREFSLREKVERTRQHVAEYVYNDCREQLKNKSYVNNHNSADQNQKILRHSWNKVNMIWQILISQRHSLFLLLRWVVEQLFNRCLSSICRRFPVCYRWHCCLFGHQRLWDGFWSIFINYY